MTLYPVEGYNGYEFKKTKEDVNHEGRGDGSGGRSSE
jgi:hypothetical protein